MHSLHSIMRRAAVPAAILGCLVLLSVKFPIRLADRFSITPVQERPFSPQQQFHHGQPQVSPQDDGYNTSVHQPERSRENHDYRLLTSLRNPMGFYNKVDLRKTGYQIMNPTLLRIPHDSKSGSDFLIIARTQHVDKEIDGKNYRLARQVAAFANLTYNKLGRPVLKADNKWSKLLVQDFAGPAHHCKHQPNMDRYIGPEDMKLFWTRTGEPLLIFTHQVDDENLCQGQFIIDVRAAVPELEDALGEQYSAQMAPIRFSQPTGLRRKPPDGQESDPRYQREKNWALAQSPLGTDDGLLLMVEPGQLFRWTSDDKPVEGIMGAEEQESAVEAPYPPGIESSDTWHSELKRTCVHDVMMDDGHVHQSTPMLSLTLCNRGNCEPDEQNTVMLGMVQRRHDPPAAPFTWYDRRIAVYEAAAPYRMLSVSKRLTYHGEVDGEYIWTGSMVYYLNQTLFPPSSHGFLDDEIWLSFGIKDAAAGWIDVQALDLIVDHYLCQGASHAYRHHRHGIAF